LALTAVLACGIDDLKGEGGHYQACPFDASSAVSLTVWVNTISALIGWFWF